MPKFITIWALFWMSRDLDQAKAHLETALQIDPHYALAHNNLGGILSRLGDLSRARLHQERAVSIDPEFADAHYQLGLTLKKQGDSSAAIEHFKQTVRIDLGYEKKIRGQ